MRRGAAAPTHHGRHGFAEQDDREEPEALGEMFAMRRHLRPVDLGGERHENVCQARDDPQHEAGRRRHDGRAKPERRGEGTSSLITGERKAASSAPAS
jgi:hypothetical protein